MRQINHQDLALFAAPIRGDHKNSTVLQQAVLKEMCEKTVLVSMKAVILIEISTYENVTEIHAFTTAKGIMHVYVSPALYITVTSISQANIHLTRHQKVGEAASAPGNISHIRDEHL